MKELAAFIKVISDSNRLAIIRAIGDDEQSVTSIINSTGLSQALVSFHLRILRRAGVVNSRRDGPFVHYSLADAAFLDLLDDLAAMAGVKGDFRSNKSLELLKTSTGGR